MSIADRLRGWPGSVPRDGLPPGRQRIVIALVGGVLLAYLLVPIVAFFVFTGGVDLGAFADPAIRSAITVSLLTAPVSTLLATVFGVPLAYALARYAFRGKRLVEALVVLPLVTPPVVGGVMLLTAVGPLTPLGRAAGALGIELSDGYVGVVLAQTFVAAPFLVITARAGFEAIDESVLRAARNLGKGPLATFRLVGLPLARGAVLAGIVLTFARALGEFGATMMVAYQPGTMPTRIWVAFVAGGIEATAPLVITLLAAGLAAVVALQSLGETIGFEA